MRASWELGLNNNETLFNPFTTVFPLLELTFCLFELLQDQSYRAYLLNYASLDHVKSCVTWSFNLKGILDNLERITEGVHLNGRAKYEGEAIFVAGEHSPYLR